MAMLLFLSCKCPPFLLLFMRPQAIASSDAVCFGGACLLFIVLRYKLRKLLFFPFLSSRFKTLDSRLQHHLEQFTLVGLLALSLCFFLTLSLSLSLSLCFSVSLSLSLFLSCSPLFQFVLLLSELMGNPRTPGVTWSRTRCCSPTRERDCQGCPSPPPFRFLSMLFHVYLFFSTRRVGETQRERGGGGGGGGGGKGQDMIEKRVREKESEIRGREEGKQWRERERKGEGDGEKGREKKDDDGGKERKEKEGETRSVQTSTRGSRWFH